MTLPQTSAFRAADVTSEKSLLERLRDWMRLAESLERQLIEAREKLSAMTGEAQRSHEEACRE